jgi:uncharacterized membrane protein YuzA (DUF378 family)
MEEHFTRAMAEIFGHSSAVLVTIFAIIMGIMAALLPVFVFKIMVDVRAINKKMDEVVSLLGRRLNR